MPAAASFSAAAIRALIGEAFSYSRPPSSLVAVTETWTWASCGS